MIVYLVFSHQKRMAQDVRIPEFAPRYVGEFPAEALGVARKVIGDAGVDLVTIFSLQTGRLYRIEDSAGTPLDMGSTVVYTCLRESFADRLVEKFYGEFARWNSPPREVQEHLHFQV